MRDDRFDRGGGESPLARPPITLQTDDEPTPGIRDDGSPDPEYAASLGLRPAGAGRRSAAFAIDAVIWLILATPTVVGVLIAATPLLAGAPLDAVDPIAIVLVLVGLAVTSVFGLVQLVLHGLRGVTIGKAALGLRSVNVATFARPGFWRVVLRALVLQASTAVLVVVGPGLLFLSAGLDPERRGRSWLDRVARAWVLDVRRGLDPFDARALRHARKAILPSSREVRAPLPSLGSAGPSRAFVPAERSSAGVVSGLPGSGSWTPPELIDPRAPEPSTAAVPLPVSAPPLVPASVGSAAAPGPRVVRLRFDDGTMVPVPASALLGRDPEPRPGERVALLLPLADPTMQLSKTHAEFGVDEEGGFWMLDRGSSNGTVAVTPAGELALPPGERTSIPLESTVEIGGRSFRVTAG
ncbi:MAG: RDD family protein [Microcella sp.]|uniref:RDD family protein n=1 Tax=Microcella sp. TaxID=1913979 RepID=UPI00271F1899|nr:RDD family protein [Microcella sp.]MDO8337757.1 RDD family protein [Microcella sp.]